MTNRHIPALHIILYITLVITVGVYLERNIYNTHRGSKIYSYVSNKLYHSNEQRKILIPDCRTQSLYYLRLIIQNKINYDKDRNTMEEYCKACWIKELSFYLNYPLDRDYGSHIPLLFAALWVTEGPILELGCGWCSTPIVHRLAAVHKRYIYTADSDYTWLGKFVIFVSDFHQIYYVDVESENTVVDPGMHVVSDWSEMGAQKKHWGVIFVDHEPPTQRKTDFDRLKDKSDILVIHDTEDIHDGLYQLKDSLTSFSYRARLNTSDWPGAHTDVVSNTHQDLIEIIKLLNKWSLDILINV